MEYTYSATAKSLFTRDERNDAAEIVYGVARDCDRLRESIAENARIVSHRFAQYARRVAAGELPDAPTRYTTELDIERDVALLTAKLETIAHMLRTCFGPAKYEAWFKALASRETA